MSRTTGAGSLHAEKFPEEACNKIKEMQNAFSVTDVIAVCGGIVTFDYGAATIAFTVVV